MLPLQIITLALDAMPWITLIYPELRKLDHAWTWNVVEGAASPEKDTNWCAPQKPRLSEDGTTEYLDSLSFDPRVRVFRSEMWHGKVEMCNEPLKHLNESCILMQMDADEIWTADRIAKVLKMFANKPQKNCADFRCKYFVGPDVVITSKNTYGNNDAYEWRRAWRVDKGARFATHEPPEIEGMKRNPFTHQETESLDLHFNHYAWATEKQVEFKSKYYAGENNPKGHLYRNAVEGWNRLQENHTWPVQLEKFLPWVGPKTMAERVK